MGSFLETLSAVCGWAYFLAWSSSFFPQPVKVFRAKTTEGSLPDYSFLNIFGFSCYSVSTILFMFSPLIKDQYAERHPESPKQTLRINDLVFGLIGLTMSLITYSQFYPRLWGWKRRSGVKRSVNNVTRVLVSGSLLALAIMTALVLASHNGENKAAGKAWYWIDAVYAVEYVKILLTCFKYIPQVVENFRRKSTYGWSIAQQLLDLTGGGLSLVQLVLDAYLQGDWSGLTGNPLKLGLSIASLIFDCIFVVQHFCLYGPVKPDDEDDDEEDGGSKDQSGDRDGERRPLLSERA